MTRCQHPQQEKFRIAIVDGFSGAGLYKCGSYGSPLIFVDVLKETATEINLKRIATGLRPIQFGCLLILNDDSRPTIEALKKNISPLVAEIKEEQENIYLQVEFFNSKFDEVYPRIKEILISTRIFNVFFNLDQCGYSHVSVKTIRDIMASWRSAEVILTFMISSLLTYLSPKETKSGVPLEPTIQDKIDTILRDQDVLLNKGQWLGEAEIIFEQLKDSAPYVSPFSINNPHGWQYWLMHFASSYRARQVYNDVLHRDNSSQVHYGRAGLKMLSYNPQDEGQLYFFDENARQSAKEELYDDIPRLVSESGDVLTMQQFYESAYSETPAHSDDIHEMIIENPDLEVITETGGARRKPNTIRANDTLKLKNQKSMFFMFDFHNKK